MADTTSASPIPLVADTFLALARRHLGLIAGYTAAALGGLMLTLTGALGDWIAKDLSLTHLQSAALQSAFFAGMLLSAFSTNRLVQLIGQRGNLLTATAAMAGGALALASGVLPIMLLGRLLSGWGFNTLAMTTSGMIIFGYKSRQSSLLSGLHAVIALMATVGLLAGRPIGELMGGWRQALVVLAALSAGPMLLAAFARYGPWGQGAKPSFKSLRGLARQPIFWCAFASVVAYVGCEQAMTVFLANHATETYGFSPTLATATVAAFWLGVLIGRVGSALAGHRVGEERQIILGLALMAGGAWLALCGLPVPCMLLGVVLAGVAGGPVVPQAYSWAMARVGHEAATMMAAFTLFSCTGGFVGPLLSGTVADHYSVTQGLAVSAAAALLGVVPMIWCAFEPAARNAASDVASVVVEP
ncbi:MAG: MFS transporter [Planctomycetota bacterium]|nr:MFS transporter [Planctomycetota bacterium]